MYIHLPNRFSTFWMLVTPLLMFYPVLSGHGQVIGAAISDLSNGLWSLWYVSSAFWDGEVFCHQQVNAPVGGCLLPADWTGLVWMLPLSVFFNPIQAFNLTLYAQTVWTGLAMYLLYQAWFPKNEIIKTGSSKALISAIVLQLSTVMRTGLHNGSTEVLSLGWVLLGLVGWNQVLAGYRWAWLLILPVIGTSWYGVTGFMLVAIVQWLYCRPSLSKSSFFFGGWVLSLWAVFVYWSVSLSSGAGNLLRIKGVAEMDSVRRTIGSADPLTYVVPWMYNSPDFAEVSRFGEQFVHSTYIGWVVLGTCLWCMKNAVKHWTIWVAVLGGVMSLGPVLILNAEPLLVEGMGIPLPYFLVEFLPLFDHLTLLYRLSWIPIVCMIGFAVHNWRTRYQWSLCVLAVLEILILSPVRNLPDCTDFSSVTELSVLDGSPPGSVGFYPLAGGRPYMASQIWHGKPLATTLNFPANKSALRVLEAIRENESVSKPLFHDRISDIAKSRGIRYWIVDMDDSMMPDEYFKGVLRLKETFPVLWSVEQPDDPTLTCSVIWDSLYVVRLW